MAILSLNKSRTCISIGLLVLHVGLGVAEQQPEDAFHLASNHYEAGNWQQAVDAFSALLTDNPNHVQADTARFLMAEALVRLNRFEEASDNYRLFLESKPGGQRAARARFRMGECALFADRPVAARRLLRKFRQVDSRHELNAYALPYLADLSLKDGNRQAARQLYVEARDQYPTGPLADAVRLQLAIIDLYDGRADLAIEALEQFLEQLGDSQHVPAAQYWLGLAHLRSDSHLDAARVLVELTDAHRDNELVPAAHFYAGEAYRSAGRDDEAFEQYQAVLDLHDPGEWLDDCLVARMRMALAAGEWKQVVSSYDEFERQITRSPLQEEAARLAARSLLRTEQYDDVGMLLEPLVSRTRTTRLRSQRVALNTNLYLLSLARIGQHRSHDALKLLDRVRVADLPPATAAGVRVARSTALMAAEDYAAATVPLREYLKLHSEGPDSLLCRSRLVIALAKSGDVAAAKLEYQRLRDSDAEGRHLMPATRNLAQALDWRTDTETARELFLRLADNYENSADAAQGLSGLAWLQLHSGDTEDAIDTFVRFLELYPGHPAAPQVSLACGQTLVRVGRREQAVKAFVSIAANYARTPQAANALFEIAMLQQRSGLHAEAVDTLEQLLRDHPEFPQRDAVQYLCAWAYVDLGAKPKAWPLFEAIASKSPSSDYWSDSLYRLAQRDVDQGDFTAALQKLDRLKRAERSAIVMPHALYLTGRIAARTERWDDVAPPLQRLLMKYPQSQLDLPASYWIAESLYQRGDYQGARKRFDELDQALESVKTKSWMGAIRLRRAQLLAARGMWLDALKLARTISSEFPGFSQQADVEYLIGRCHSARAEFSQARKHYQAVVDAQSADPSEAAAMAQWMIGETYFHQKAYDDAIEAYLRVDRRYDAPRWQAAALLQAGKCFERKGERQEAAKLYARVISSFPTTQFTTKAVTRLREVDTMKERYP